MAADNAAAWPRDAEIPLTDVRSVPKTGLARPPPTQQTARKGRLNFLYACVYRSADAANYLRGDEGFALLYARRLVAADLLRRAHPRDTPLGRMRVISAEGLMGFKLQALHNDPSRHRDLDDIRQLLRANRGQLDLAEVRRYFQLFEREALLDELLAELN